MADETKLGPRTYLAGPMTGLPDYNYPAFNAEAARLRSLGMHIENPAENPEKASWEAYLRQALTQMLTCDCIHFLPGWTKSRGATLEFIVAYRLGVVMTFAPGAEPAYDPDRMAFGSAADEVPQT
ncbi:DUF4406 domain-containing protein [Flagellatimonas centrodinii]|uniref:DUF4406 domain-containing protein n=1 Tax=Flagellatimonas centrodinii TaxID=2806210 RepID=UPI001FED9178|nr:DUF4406 domain-containing protein [Flagellatimonas centrodinii]ULQ46976.1 DUF4406 domain-containing protein [Flagellatimonas centrodinii]